MNWKWIHEKDSELKMNAQEDCQFAIDIHGEFAKNIVNLKWIRIQVGEFIMNLQKKVIELKVDWRKEIVNPKFFSCKTEWIHSLFAKIKVNSKLIHERSSDSILKSRIISS